LRIPAELIEKLDELVDTFGTERDKRRILMKTVAHNTIDEKKYMSPVPVLHQTSLQLKEG